MRRWPVTLYLCTTMLTVAQQGARVAKEGTSCFSGLCPCRIWPPVDCCALRVLRNIKGSHPVFILVQVCPFTLLSLPWAQWACMT